MPGPDDGVPHSASRPRLVSSLAHRAGSTQSWRGPPCESSLTIELPAAGALWTRAALGPTEGAAMPSHVPKPPRGGSRSMNRNKLS